MKKKRGNEEEKGGKKLVGVVMVGIVVSAVVMTLLPLAAAPVTITKFEITPANNIAGATSAYTIQVNTTGFKSLNISIPAGFKAKAPSGGDLIARVDLWWDDPSPYYGYVTFTANASDPSGKMDVYADIGGGTASLTEDVNYTEGATTSIKSPFGAHPERANLTLPTTEKKGWLNITGLPDEITNVTVSIGEFVRNPAIAGDYVFIADGVFETVHIRAIPVPVPVVNTLGLLALIGILSIVLATSVKRKRK